MGALMSTHCMARVRAALLQPKHWSEADCAPLAPRAAVMPPYLRDDGPPAAATETRVLFRVRAEGALVGYCLRSGDFVIVAPLAAGVLGTSIESAVGANLLELVRAEDRAPLPDPLAAAAGRIVRVAATGAYLAVEPVRVRETARIAFVVAQAQTLPPPGRRQNVDMEPHYVGDASSSSSSSSSRRASFDYESSGGDGSGSGFAAAAAAAVAAAATRSRGSSRSSRAGSRSSSAHDDDCAYYHSADETESESDADVPTAAAKRLSYERCGGAAAAAGVP